MVELALGVLAGGVASILIHLGLSVHTRRTRMLKHYRARFFDDAEHLLKEDCLTDDQLARLRRMVGDMDSKVAFRALEIVVATSHADIKRNRYSAGRGITSPAWGSLIYNYFLTLSYLRTLKGWTMRARLATIFDPQFGSDEAEAIDERLHGATILQRA
jgi:hypothetical protein